MSLADEKLEIIQNILVLADAGIVRKAKELIQALVEQELSGEIDLDEELSIAPASKKVVAPEKKRGRRTRVERSSLFEMDEYEREMVDRDRAAGISSFDDASDEFDGWGGGGSKKSSGYDDDDE